MTRVLEVSTPGILTFILGNQRIRSTDRGMYVSKRLLSARTVHVATRIPRFDRFTPCAIYGDVCL
jgi:hypothetical protein